MAAANGDGIIVIASLWLYTYITITGRLDATVGASKLY